jgi:hypothetical protein
MVIMPIDLKCTVSQLSHIFVLDTSGFLRLEIEYLLIEYLLVSCALILQSPESHDYTLNSPSRGFEDPRPILPFLFSGSVSSIIEPNSLSSWTD